MHRHQRSYNDLAHNSVSQLSQNKETKLPPDVLVVFLTASEV